MRKRILFILQLAPPVHGAAVINEMIIGNPLIREDYDTKVLPLRFVSAIHEIGSFSWKKVGLMLSFLLKLMVELMRFRPHLIYYTISPKGGSFYRDALFVLLCKIFRRKIIFHLHSRGIQEAKKKNSFNNFIYSFVYKGAYVVCLSDKIKDEFDGLKVKDIFILPNTIPPDSYPAKRQVERPTLFFLSNLLRDKGIFVFIEIIRQLAEKNYLFSATITGMDGDITAGELTQLIEERGLPNTVVTGARYGKEKYTTFEEASIFVMPSLNEAFPLVILEAMQAALPVVASDVGAISDMVKEGETGYLCPPGDVAKFVEKIALLLEQPALQRQLGENGLSVFNREFSINQFEYRLKGFVEHVLNDQ
jgi:glycosyltransferase involved in cell wall biosynthesis